MLDVTNSDNFMNQIIYHINARTTPNGCVLFLYIEFGIVRDIKKTNKQ